MNNLLPIADLSAELSWIIFAADVTLKVTLIFAAAAFVTFCLRRKSAALRHRIWSLAVAAGLVIPLLAAVMPQWQVPIFPVWFADHFAPPVKMFVKDVLIAPRLPIETIDELRTIVEQPQRELPPPRPIDFPPDREIEPVTLPAFHAEPVVIADDATEETSVRDPLPSSPLPGTILVIWLTGFALCLLRLCAGSLFNALLLSKSRRVTDRQWTQLIDDARRRLGLRRRVRLFVVDRNVIPMTWGIWRPLILLPGSSSGWSESRRRIVLLHELAHVARFDPPLQLMTRLVTALYWFHPFVWLAAYRLQVEREFACDDCVINAGQRATDYAAELVAIAETHRMPRLTSALTMARTSRLEARLRSMFDRARSHQPLHRSVAVALVVISGLVASSLAMMQPVSRGEVGEETKVAEASTDEASDRKKKNSIAAADTDSKKITIVGECVSLDDNNPLANAHVKVYRFPLKDAEPHVVAETFSDAEGTFRFENVETSILKYRESQSDELLLLNNMYDLSVVVSLDGYSTAMKNIDKIDDFDEPVELSFDLTKDTGALWGVVKDPQGNPVPGVSVSRVSSHKTIPGLSNTVTDEQGLFAISHLPNEPSRYTTLYNPKTTQGEYTPIVITNLTLRRGDDPPMFVGYTAIPQQLKITMHPPGVIKGRVVDTVTNQPLTGVSVRATGIARNDWRVTDTDNNGKYQLKCTPGYYNIWIDYPDRVAAAPVLELKPGETIANVDFELSEGVIISGTIRDDEGKIYSVRGNGQPMTVACHGPASPNIGGRVRPVNVDADGRYRLRVAPGKNFIYVMNSEASKNIDVESGQEVNYHFLLGQKEDDMSAPGNFLHAEIYYQMQLETAARIVDDTEKPAAETPKAEPETEKTPTTYKPTENLIKARKAVERGIAYLLAQQNDDGTWTAKENFTVGCTALCTLALLEAGAAKDNDQIVKALDYLAAQKPDKTYEVATQTLAFCAADAEKYRAEIQRNVDWLQDAQLDNGTWTYGSLKTADDDASNAEFAIWALDEAAYAGFEIRKDTWKKTRKYFIESQLPGGSWAYTPQAKAGTGSMTCAGIASLCICLDHLDDADAPEYEQAVIAVEHGFLWLREHYTVKQNPGSPNWHLYYLMLLRRVGELTGVLSLADPHSGWDSDVNAFFANAKHRKDGSWSENGGNAGDHMATAFVLLTLKDNHARDSIYKHKRVRGKVGRVVDEQGQPLKNGPVMISWVMAGLQQSHTVVARTNDNGEFEFYYPPKFVRYQWRLALDSSRKGGSKPEVIQEDPLVLRVPRVRNSLLGIWKIVPNENKDLPQTYQPGTEVFIASDTISYWFDLNTDVKMHEEEYLVNAFHTPAHIDIVTKDNVHLGVFEVNHDRLSLCIERNESERPAEVTPKTNADQYSILTLQRIDVRKTVAPFFDFKKITPVEEKIFATLQASGEIDFNQIPIKDALTFLGEQYGVQVVYDEAGANKAGIDPNVTVTLTLTHVSLHEALVMILRPLKLKYIVEDGAIKVTAAE
ncbi:MAG: carboxypeptidase regulatory-like domain-containing protein [Planctomycetaceae bacterium]